MLSVVHTEHLGGTSFIVNIEDYFYTVKTPWITVVSIVDAKVQNIIWYI